METLSKQTKLEKITLEEFASMVKSVEPSSWEKKEFSNKKWSQKILNTLRYHIARGCYSEIDYTKYIAPHTIGGDDFTLVIECRSYEDLYPDYDDVFSTFFNGALFRGKPQIEDKSNLRLIGNAIALFGDIGNKKDELERDEHYEMGRLFHHLYYNVVNQQSN